MKCFNHKLLILTGLFVASLIFADTVNACSCGRGEEINKVLSKTNNVFVLRLESIENINDEFGKYSHQNANFVVKRVFKGKSSLNEVITFRQREYVTSSCNWTVNQETIGEDYLFFLNDTKLTDEPLRLWMCTRTRLVKDARKDLLYLEKEEKVRGKTRLSGNFKQIISSFNGWQFNKYIDLSDMKLRIVGNGKDIEVTTDKFGVFEVYDLPPGFYKLFPESVSGYEHDFDSSVIRMLEKRAYNIVKIESKSHVEVGFNYKIRNSLKGKLYDTNGIPLERVNLKLIPLEQVGKSRFYGENAYSKKDGSFEFKMIPVGTYYIAINPGGFVTAKQPFKTFYYPNVENIENASTFTFSPGYILENIIINAPETAETITIVGKVVYEDEKPANRKNAQYISINFIPVDKGKEETTSSSTRVDEFGNFKIKILEGKKGRIVGSISTYKGKYENCKKHDDILIRQTKNSLSETIFGSIKTNFVEVDTNQDSEGIILRLPYPSCKRKQIK